MIDTPQPTAQIPTASPPTPEDLRTQYADAYDWADRQPSLSYDFVAVPIESLAELLRRSDP